MKLTEAELGELKSALQSTMQSRGITPEGVRTTAAAWDLFHAAWRDKALDGNELYIRYTDAHIETALRRVLGLPRVVELATPPSADPIKKKIA